MKMKLIQSKPKQSEVPQREREEEKKAKRRRRRRRGQEDATGGVAIQMRQAVAQAP